MPKVSIIIPFNNVEQYIKECLESVVNQKLKDIEIICVNDASEDNSRQIAEEYAKKDDRIKIIDIETRQGQGYARNRAMEIASGEYIGFVDADDYIEPDMFLELYAKASLNGNDITICQAREYDELNEKFILSDYYSLTVLNRMEDRVFSAVDVKDELLEINVVLWNKIYKKSYLEKIAEKFPEGYIYEDLPFFFGTFLPAERIQILWKNLYIYRINRKNSTMQQFNNKILDRLDMVSLTYEKLKQYDFLSDIMPKIQGWIINDLFHRYTLLKENCQREFFFKMKKIFESLDINNPENPYWRKVYHFEGYLMVLNNDFDNFNQKIFTNYLDIHKVEDRLKSQLSTYTELEDKLNKIYSDLATNYEYTKNTYEKAMFNYEKLFEICNEKTDELREYIKINSEKICEVEANLYKDIKEKNDNLSAIVDKKISDIRFEVNKGIEDIYVKNKQDKESLIDLINKSSENLKLIINNEETIRTNEINIKIDNNQREIKEQLSHNINHVLELIENKIDKERQNYQKDLIEMKKQFEIEINEQKKQYEDRIDILQNRIFELEKTPLQKIKDKIKKNR